MGENKESLLTFQTLTEFVENRYFSEQETEGENETYFLFDKFTQKLILSNQSYLFIKNYIFQQALPFLEKAKENFQVTSLKFSDSKYIFCRLQMNKRNIRLYFYDIYSVNLHWGENINNAVSLDYKNKVEFFENSKSNKLECRTTRKDKNILYSCDENLFSILEILEILKEKCLLLNNYLEEMSEYVLLKDSNIFYLQDFFVTNNKKEFLNLKYKSFRKYSESFKIDSNKFGLIENYFLFKLSVYLSKKEHARIRKFSSFLKHEKGIHFFNEVIKRNIYKKDFKNFINLLSVIYYVRIQLDHMEQISLEEKQYFFDLFRDALSMQKDLKEKIEINTSCTLKGIKKHHDRLMEKILHKRLKNVNNNKIKFHPQILKFIEGFPKEYFVFLDSESEVLKEALWIKHCVYSNYWGSIKNQRYIVFSYISKFNQERLTVGIRVHKDRKTHQFYLDQVYGKHNKIPTDVQLEKEYLSSLILENQKKVNLENTNKKKKNVL